MSCRWTNDWTCSSLSSIVEKKSVVSRPNQFHQTEERIPPSRPNISPSIGSDRFDFDRAVNKQMGDIRYSIVPSSMHGTSVLPVFLRCYTVRLGINLVLPFRHAFLKLKSTIF